MNKRLYLASSISHTAKSIADDIGDVSGLRLVFVDTAAEVEEGEKDWLENDMKGMIDAGFDLFEYTIAEKNYDELEKELSDIDIIHVNGGNNFYFSQQARKSGFDKFVRQHIDAGKIYIGSSAGSIAISPSLEHLKSLDDISKAPDLENLKGFGIIDITVFPHWGSEIFPFDKRQKALKDLYKDDKKVILLSDKQYVKIDGECLTIEQVHK